MCPLMTSPVQQAATKQAELVKTKAELEAKSGLAAELQTMLEASQHDHKAAEKNAVDLKSRLLERTSAAAALKEETAQLQAQLI